MEPAGLSCGFEDSLDELWTDVGVLGIWNLGDSIVLRDLTDVGVLGILNLGDSTVRRDLTLGEQEGEDLDNGDFGIKEISFLGVFGVGEGGWIPIELQVPANSLICFS